MTTPIRRAPVRSHSRNSAPCRSSSTYRVMPAILGPTTDKLVALQFLVRDQPEGDGSQRYRGDGDQQGSGDVGVLYQRGGAGHRRRQEQGGCSGQPPAAQGGGMD